MTNVNEIIDKDVAFRRTLGQRILKIRRSQGLSQVELARRVGVEGSRLSHWEKGSHMPSLTQVVEIALALQVGLEELVLGKAPVPPEEMGGLTSKERERLAVCLRAAMEILRKEERERLAQARRPGAPKQGSISPRRSR
jgi:transcriptional regulator with XRE-family HTH domain